MITELHTFAHREKEPETLLPAFAEYLATKPREVSWRDTPPVTLFIESIATLDVPQSIQLAEQVAKHGDDLKKRLEEDSSLDFSLQDDDPAWYMRVIYREFAKALSKPEIKNTPELRLQAEHALLDLNHAYAEAYLKKDADAALDDDHDAEREEDIHYGPSPMDTIDFKRGDWEQELLFLERDYVSEFNLDLSPIFETIPVLAEIGGKDSVDFLVEWLRSFPDAYPLHIADACSKIDPAYAASKLLPLLREKPADATRNAYQAMLRKCVTAALYRFEFGQIGISQEGVAYLQKQYDLGEYNREEYIAQRLTADGKMGVFDENKKLVKLFALEGLDREEATLRARMFDLTYEMLFVTRAEENPDERAKREQYLKEFQENYFGFYADDFFKETGVAFNNLGLREQGQFLVFSKNAQPQERQRAMAFVGRYKEWGLRSFLSLEQDEDMGQVILAIGEQLDPDVAEHVFAQYASLVSATDDVCGYVRARVAKDRIVSTATLDKLAGHLLSRGREVLDRCAEELRTASNSEEAGRRILANLKRARADIAVFATAFKAVSSEAILPLEDVADAQFSSCDAAELRDQDRRTMEKIFMDNRSGYSPELLAKTREEFVGAMQKPGTTWHVFRHGGEIVSFVRFESLPNGHVYGGSLNTRPEARGSAVGSALLQATLEKEARLHPVEAVVHAKNPMLKHYVGDFGMKIVGEDANYQGTGELYYKLLRDDRVPAITAEAKAA